MSNVSVLFPLWPEAKVLLSQLYKDFMGWEVSGEMDTLNIQPIFARRINKDGKSVSLLETFPVEYQNKVADIISSTAKQWFHNLDLRPFLHRNIDPVVRNQIQSLVLDHDRNMDYSFRKTFVEELMQAFGLL